LEREEEAELAVLKKKAEEEINQQGSPVGDRPPNRRFALMFCKNSLEGEKRKQKKKTPAAGM
jgi:hypothetical protein